MDLNKEKRVSDSHTEQIQLVMSQHINGSGRLFGGQLMAWIDVVAGVTARRHSGRNVTTASLDSLQFKKAAYVGDTIVIIGEVTHVGASSMEIRVDSYIERLDGSKELINRAYLTFVALDEQDKPVIVPRLILETDQQKEEWEAAEKRNALRKQRRYEQY